VKSNHIDPALAARARVENSNPYSNEPGPFLAKVIAVHSDTGRIDVALDGKVQGGILYGVPVTSWSYGTQTGETYLPSNIKLAAPIPTEFGAYDQPIPSGDQDVWAVIVFLGRRAQRPICLGFQSPYNSQVHTVNAGWKVSLHESGIWTAISPAGDVQTGYPDGSYTLASTGDTPVDMTQENAEWSPQTTTTPYNLTLNVKGTVNLTVSGTVTVNASEVYVGTVTGGGKPIARDGDVVVGGVIQASSTKVYAG